jgi:AraC family transcriptional regulator, regulatory protein of adaptative response / methylated-DNA-[protein]-cysteine methyltransferase
MRDLREDALWAAIARRDSSFSGVFWFGVKSTGIYCRPGCPSPLPKRENVVCSFSPGELAHAGFRPCRRCRPDESGNSAESVDLIVSVCRFIDESVDMPSLEQLASRAGLSESALSRRFKEALGITPREYADSRRRERLRLALRRDRDVLDASFDAGYGSTSRVYESANGHLGMTPGTYRDGGKGKILNHAVVQTPLGYLLVAATAKGISAVKLGDEPEALLEELRREFPRAELLEAGARLLEWLSQLVDYLSGRLSWPELPYDVRATAFQRMVWEFLRSIPPGRTMHYSEVAEALGSPRSTRAVARACATNPVALVVPCHRVVPKGRGFAGFRWGIPRKQKLLELEGSPESRRSCGGLAAAEQEPAGRVDGGR